MLDAMMPDPVESVQALLDATKTADKPALRGPAVRTLGGLLSRPYVLQADGAGLSDPDRGDITLWPRQQLQQS